MKNSWQIITILMGVAIVALSINVLTQKTNNEEITTIDKGDIVYDMIMSRSSVRSYTSQKIENNVVKQLLKAGMAAPTAGNRQPWEFYVVRDTAIIRQFAKVTEYADPMAQNADLAIVVCGVPSEAFPKEPNYWIQDVSAASENILLSAHALGLGAVWCGVYPSENRVATLRNLLDAPDNLIPFNIIMLGYPDSVPIIKDKWKQSKVHYKN